MTGIWWRGALKGITSIKSFMAITALVFPLEIGAASLRQLSADVVIYGGTPAGIAAAEAVVRAGKSAIVVEPTSNIGGMETGGIAVTDTDTPQYVGGIAHEFFEEVSAREASRRAQAPVMHFRGESIRWSQPKAWDLEPKLAKQVFDGWVAKGRYRVLLRERIVKVKKAGAIIAQLILEDGTEISGKEFIDASYEGDLLAHAGVEFTYGRESTAQYHESLAGVRKPHFVRNYTQQEYSIPTREYMHHGQFGADIAGKQDGRLLWGVEPEPLGTVGSGDDRMQAFCFRLVVTQNPDLKRAWWTPRNYDSSHYELLLKYIEAHPNITFTRLVHLGPVPNGEWDLNASGPFSIDFIGGNVGFFESAYKKRDEIIQAHKDYEQGFLWFLATDKRVPQQLREEVMSWGPVKDEWPDNDNWPTQIYIREGRRMVSDFVMTEKDILEDKVKTDSVGMGSFVLDSHWVRRIMNDQGFVRVEGNLDESINLANAPYEIPYRVLLPKRSEAENLLVPVDISATHVAICTIRMEPVYMELGQSAGTAAVLALDSKRAVQDIDVHTLTQELAKAGQVLHKERPASLPKMQ